jgi:hypothetical protein
VGTLSDLTIKDAFVEGLSSDALRGALSTHMHKGVQKLQARAADFEYAMKKGKGKGVQTDSSWQQRPQNKDRKWCRECNGWFNPKKGETCHCASRRPQGGSKPGSSSRPQGESSRRPRVQEAIIEEEDDLELQIEEAGGATEQGSDHGSDHGSEPPPPPREGRVKGF